MKQKEQLLKEQAIELERFDKEVMLREALAGVPGYDAKNSFVYFHRDHVSVRLWKDYRTEKTLTDACAVVEYFKHQIIDAEHWKGKNGGCVSCRPSEINSNATDENIMDGAHAVEVSVSGGRGFGPDVKVRFWTRIGGCLCEMELPIVGQQKLCPRVTGNYTTHGDFSGNVEWNWQETQVVDRFRKWWSEAPAYRGSYYLADVPNFETWASNHVNEAREILKDF